ncbi:MAG: hypothetical protein HQL64_03710 [Magnetococcales bacterium]|nr:hypothetical protein [Magnetococcales bacterium]
MKPLRTISLLLGVVAVSGTVGMADLTAKEPESAPKSAGNEGGKANKWSADPHQIAQRMDSVSTLINKSSGAQRIAAAGNPEISAMRDEALAHLQEARAAYDNKDYEGAKKLLGHASQTMFEAMRKADGGASGREKNSQDFERRLASVKVLMDAHVRIAGEKGRGQETSSQIQSAMDEAVKTQKGGDVVRARARLDEAYITAKLGIEKLRRGDTLVRTLHFKDKEEEYHYEVDRNDTHQMLVNMLLQNKGDSVKQMAEQFVKRARELRTKAEKQAAAKSFEEAVATMESSTDELVRAIRGAGVYIPG